MNKNYLNIIVRFVVLVLVQVIILERINLHGYINPYIYPLFLLLLPIKIKNWLLMLLGFFLGICIDMFTNTLGIHSAACVLLTFIRPFVIDILTPSGGYEKEMKPTIRSLGFTWFLTYTFVLILFHHILLFLLEVFRLTELMHTISKAFISVLFSVTLILIIEYMTISKKRFR